jgi:putative nucleotidyltransferase with HDIG domain
MKKEKFLEITSYIDEITKGSEFEGHIFAVGGSVRDLVMELEIKDIDLVIDLPQGGIRFADFCEMKGLTGKVVIYETYGTAMFHFKKFPEEEIECVMTRGEKYTDLGSRNPVTEFAGIKEDATRRDLTINALYYNISERKVEDFTGYGIQDIHDSILRVPMEVVSDQMVDQTFIDDPLRILRVIRFSCKLGFKISDKTFEAMKRNVNRLRIIKAERINTELCKILMSRYAKDGIETISEIGAMNYVIPELDLCKGLEQNAYHFGDVWVHTMAVLENDCKLFEPDLICRLAALLHDIGKIMCRTVKNGKVHFYDHEYIGSDVAKGILMRLKFDNHTIDEVCFIIRNHMRTKGFENDCRKMKNKHVNRFMYICGTMERFERTCRVIEDDNLAHEKSHCITGQYRKFMECASVSKMFGYKLPVDGNDIMDALNIKPGRIVKQILDVLISNACSNPEITRQTCLKIAKETFRNLIKNDENTKELISLFHQNVGVVSPEEYKRYL